MRAYGRTAEANRGILVMKVFAARDERGQVAVCEGPPRKVIFATAERAARAAGAILEINAERPIAEALQVPYPCPLAAHFHLRNERERKRRHNRQLKQNRKHRKRLRRERLNAMRAAVAPFLKHEPIRPLWAYYPQPARPELLTWQREAWGHNEMLRAMLDEPISVVHPIFENGIAYGHADVDAEAFERAIHHTQAEFEKAMGVKPTVIDLPNWARGTILEQIAFTNGFTIADRRPDED